VTKDTGSGDEWLFLSDELFLKARLAILPSPGVTSNTITLLDGGVRARRGEEVQKVGAALRDARALNSHGPRAPRAAAALAVELSMLAAWLLRRTLSPGSRKQSDTK
jgi:hypothetical protein